MLQRFVEFVDKNVFEDWDDDDLVLFDTREISIIKILRKKYEELGRITEVLQSDSTTCRDVRILFDAVIDEYPVAKTRLPNDSKIFSQPSFESAMLKIQSGAVGKLTMDEKT